MSDISWNSSDLSVADPQCWELTIANTSYNVTSCCSKSTMSTPCRVTFDIAVMSIVIISNVTKAICMFLVVLKANDYPLDTLADAIASFLETHDPTRKHRCLLSKHDVLNEEFRKSPLRLKSWKEGSERLTDAQFYAVSARCRACVNFLYEQKQILNPSTFN